jgi:hypothetical protein
LVGRGSCELQRERGNERRGKERIRDGVSSEQDGNEESVSSGQERKEAGRVEGVGRGVSWGFGWEGSNMPCMGFGGSGLTSARKLGFWAAN